MILYADDAELIHSATTPLELNKIFNVILTLFRTGIPIIG